MKMHGNPFSRHPKMQVSFRKRATNHRALLRCFRHSMHFRQRVDTGWQEFIGSLKLHVSFRKKVTNYRDVWQEMTYDL